MSNARKAVSPGRAIAILSSIRLAMLTIALIGLPFVIDDIEPAIALAMVALGLVAAYFTWRSYKVARDAEMDRVFVPVTDRPAAEQRLIYKRALIACAFACAGLSWDAWSDISTAAPGDMISLWAPLAMMYDLAGPWGAILTPVGIWIGLALTVVKRERDLRRRERLAA